MPQLDDRTAWRWALILVGAAALIRLLVLAVTPLQLYPDEAQYWLWAQSPAAGYVSKPPMVAWLIAASTAFADGEFWVRLPAVAIHAAIALVLFKAAGRLAGPDQGPWAGLLAAALWALAPAVAVSSLFISTDAPLALFLSLALWAYAELLVGDGRIRLLLGAALGAALGLAFLSKQAALYYAGGLLLHAMVDRQARAAWRGWAWAAALAAFALAIAPNIAWQTAHDFATVSHTVVVNARAEDGLAFKPLGPLEFVFGQIASIGPMAAAGFALAVWAAVRRRAVSSQRLGLMLLAAPPLAVIVAASLFDRGRTQWAAAAYPAVVVLAAVFLSGAPSRRWLKGGLALQAGIAALICVVAAGPGLADAVGLGSKLHRLRGWDATVDAVARAAQASAPVSAVAVEDRRLFNALAYYGRETAGPPLRMRPPDAGPLNQAELDAPLTPAEGARVLIVTASDGEAPRDLRAGFARVGPAGETEVALGPKRTRTVKFEIGEAYAGPARG